MAQIVRRIRNRLRRICYRWTGRPVGRLVQIDAANAAEIAARYPGVTAVTRDEDGGLSALTPRHLPEDSAPGLRPFAMRCESIVLDIRNPGFSFSNNVLHDPSMNVLFAGDRGVDGEVLGNRPYVSGHCEKITGTVAYLSETWVDNYYHWMQAALPLLVNYRELAPAARPDFYYIMSGMPRLTITSARRWRAPASPPAKS